MIDRQFWKNAKAAWMNEEPVPVSKIWADSPIEEPPGEMEEMEKSVFEESKAAAENPESGRPLLDVMQFENALAGKTIPDTIEAVKLLRACSLPKEMDLKYEELLKALVGLQEAAEKYAAVYHVNLEEFHDFYIPQTLQLTADYLEYLQLGISADIVMDTEKEVMDAVKKLTLAVHEKRDELCSTALMEMKASAKAVNALMSQSGYVDPEYKI